MSSESLIKKLLSLVAAALALVSCVPAAYGQARIIDAPTIQIPAGSTFDASLASQTLAARFVSTLPGTCLAGELAVLTSTTPYTLEICGALNTWSAYASLNTSGQVPLANLPTIPYSQTSGVQATIPPSTYAPFGTTGGGVAGTQYTNVAGSFAAAISACGTSVSCSIIAPPSYTASDPVPGFSSDPNAPAACNTGGNILLQAQNQGNIQFGCNYAGYVYSLQRAANWWQQTTYNALPTGQILSILNLQLDAYDGGHNTEANGYADKSTFSPLSIHNNVWTRGQVVTLGITTTHAGLGDSLGIENYVLCPIRGLNATQDEGCEAQNNEVYEGNGAVMDTYAGTLTGTPATGATSVSLSVTGGNLFQASGAYLLNDALAYSTGTLASYSSPGGLTTWNGTGTSWPVSTATGTLGTAITALGSATVTPTFTSGSMSAVTTATPVCVSDGGNEELVYPSSVGGSTFTALWRYPHSSSATFGVAGACGQYLIPSADDVSNTTYTSAGIYNNQTIIGTIHTGFPVVSSTATQLTTHIAENGYYATYPSRFDAATANGYSLVPGAEITSVQTGGVVSNTLTLAPNNVAWATGNHVEQLSPAGGRFHFGNNLVESYHPSIGGGLLGHGLTYNQPLHDLDTMWGLRYNAPKAWYGMHGGKYNEPRGISIVGETGRTFQIDPSSFGTINVGCDTTITGGVGGCTGAGAFQTFYTQQSGSDQHYNSFGFDANQQCFFTSGFPGSTRTCLPTTAGSGTVASGTAGSLAKYASTGTTVSPYTPVRADVVSWLGYTPSGGGGLTIGEKLRTAAVRADASNATINPPLIAPVAWAASTSYFLGQIVSNGGNLYEVVAPATGTATSGSSGGPTGTGAAIAADGGVTWMFYQSPVPTGSNPNVLVTYPTSSCSSGLSQSIVANLSGASLNPLFTMHGATPFIWSTFAVAAANATVVNSGNTPGQTGTPTLQDNGVQYVFNTDAPKICISAAANGGTANNLRFLVNDSYLTLSAARPYYSGGNAYTLIDFGTSADGRKPRKITLESENSVYFNGVYVDSISTVWPEGQFEVPIKAAFLGNSILAGGGYNTAIAGDNIPFSVAKKLGWSDAFNMGEGGTDYQNNDAGAGYSYINHIPTDLARATFDVVCFCLGGINDTAVSGYNATNEQAAALAAFQAARTAAPNAVILVTGPYPGTNGGVVALENAIFAGWKQFSSAYTGTDGNTFFIPVSVGSNAGSAIAPTQSPWVSGAGYVSAPSGAGNSDIYVGQDQTHQSPIGTKYLSERLAQAIRLLLPLIP